MKLILIILYLLKLLAISKSYNTPKYIHSLAQKNYKLCPFFGNKLIKKKYLKLNNDQRKEMYQEGYIGLLHACRKYNESKGAKISTYSYFWINRYMNNYIQKFIIDKPKEIKINYDVVATYDNPIFDTNLLQTLNENEKIVIKLRYFKNMKVKDISSILKVSRNTVTNWCNSAKKKIKLELNK